MRRLVVAALILGSLLGCSQEMPPFPNYGDARRIDAGAAQDGAASPDSPGPDLDGAIPGDAAMLDGPDGGDAAPLDGGLDALTDAGAPDTL